MNKQGKGKIEWTDWTWNPITGCKGQCPYCYARRLFTRFHKSFVPTFYPERLAELKKLKKPAKVFVCSVADMFASWTPYEWVQAILDEIQKPVYNHLTFQLLTKYPDYIYRKIKPKDNIWIGTTITHQREMNNMYALVNKWEGIKFLCFEPLLEHITLPMNRYYLTKIDWVIIGGLTGSKKITSQKEWVASLLRNCSHWNIPIFLKSNLKPIWNEELKQEFPREI